MFALYRCIEVEHDLVSRSPLVRAPQDPQPCSIRVASLGGWGWPIAQVLPRFLEEMSEIGTIPDFGSCFPVRCFGMAF